MVSRSLDIGAKYPARLREEILAARDAARAAGDVVDSLLIHTSYRRASEAQITQKDYGEALKVVRTLLPDVSHMEIPLRNGTRLFPSSFRNLHKLVLSRSGTGLTRPPTIIPPLPPSLEYLHLRHLETDGFSSMCPNLKTLLLTAVTFPEPDYLIRCLRDTPALEILGLSCVRDSLTPTTSAKIPATVKHVYSSDSTSRGALAALPDTVSSLTYVEPAHLLTRHSQLSGLSYSCHKKKISFTRKEEACRRGPHYPVEAWAEEKLKGIA
ncbi:hypothetical protein Rt10032_c13g4979 [Rhodotorula toruloides]|uniref:Proteophosphoglycan ppg4 n=1 Tax=Rhodotorula toruloides TaxID=5286 RepID=A0A511KKQ2_RHOTO|nr:hypothetical protein Rt10032_c13g4979 [Rhodotorula toruloides]